MRQMVPYPQRGPTVQFRCTECDWAFNITNPIPEGAHVQERRKATAWFAFHNCADHPRHVLKPQSR